MNKISDLKIMRYLNLKLKKKNEKRIKFKRIISILVTKQKNFI